MGRRETFSSHVGDGLSTSGNGRLDIQPQEEPDNPKKGQRGDLRKKVEKEGGLCAIHDIQL